MPYPFLEEQTTFDHRSSLLSGKPPDPPQMAQLNTTSTGAPTVSNSGSNNTKLGQSQDLTDTPEIEPLLNLYYPMATANPDPHHYDRPYTSSVFSFSTASPTSMYDMDFYSSTFASRPGTGNLVESQSRPSAPNNNIPSQVQIPKDPVTFYSTLLELNRLPNTQNFTNPPQSSSSSVINPIIHNGPDRSVDNYQHSSLNVQHRGSNGWDFAQMGLPNVNTNLNINTHGSNDFEDGSHRGSNHDEYEAEDDADDEDADNSDLDQHGHFSHQRRFSSSRTSSSSALAMQMSNGSYSINNNNINSRKVSDSRLSAQGLAEVLNLNSAEEALRRERFILDIFERELHYPLGYKTWVRDTSKEYRTQLLDQLYHRVIQTYPEYDKPVLETIIRRATYYMMQSRLRRERRAKAKQKRDQDRGDRDAKDAGNQSTDMGFTHQTGNTGSAFMM
ncbi:LANO_0E06986g1_1 [Lachancea nothofagi CBS 11611]|uniref:LANO_0E06986g1_1 n=1 Tax=Lachancea nothofagi CBS 11611 TaxID=1266666 RepID=A0A1G4JU97_9SACH|nr:LANO_0E06986g1_1 [Lachancea nothofagi CBS 11611]